MADGNLQDAELVRELQDLERARHEKIDTMEQARLDAIARLAMADSFANPEHARRIEKVQQKQVTSLKTRQPQFVDGNDDETEDIRTLQQIEAAKHQKIDTYEQGRLDMIARLAMGESNSHPKGNLLNARQMQKQSILSKSGDLIKDTLASRANNNNNINNTNNNNNNNNNKSREERQIMTDDGNNNDSMIDDTFGTITIDYDNDIEPSKLAQKFKIDMNNLQDRYKATLKLIEERYMNKIENLQLKVESDKALLRSKDETIANLTKDNAKKVNALIRSKLNLIKATSKEIDSLRKQIKMSNKSSSTKK